MKKIPLRTCAISKEKCEKKDLFRVVRMPDGSVIFDETNKANGHGVYLKKSKEVIEKAQKGKILNKVLETEVPVDIYEKLIERCGE